MAVSPGSISRYSYDARMNRYRENATGRYISEAMIRRAIDGMIDDETRAAKALSQDLRDGRITLAHWQAQMTTQLKSLHVAMGLAASGGLSHISAQDMGILAAHIKGQYVFLREMALQIRTGQQPLNGLLITRTALYIQEARATFEMTVRRKAQENGSLTEECNILGLADHCTGERSCIEQTARGWVPIGTLVPVGQRLCIGNCRCRLAYR